MSLLTKSRHIRLRTTNVSLLLWRQQQHLTTRTPRLLRFATQLQTKQLQQQQFQKCRLSSSSSSSSFIGSNTTKNNNNTTSNTNVAASSAKTTNDDVSKKSNVVVSSRSDASIGGPVSSTTILLLVMGIASASSAVVAYQNIQCEDRFKEEAMKKSLQEEARSDNLDTTKNTNNTEDDGTVLKLQSPSTSQRVTLIGTAHISKKSNELVESVIESVRPDAVLVELDRTRLHRIGLTEADLGDDFVVAGDDIRPPLLQDDIEADAQKAWWSPATNLFLDALSQLGRKLLTRKYETMEQDMARDGDGDEEKVMGGGEFLSAIQTSKRINPDTKIILGDRSSVVTMRRIAELAMRSGDLWGIFKRLKEANKAATEQLKAKVRKNLGKGTTEAEFTVAMVEAVKSDAGFRQRLLAQVEEAVPQVTRALLTERDYIMAEAILQEKDAKHIIAVVGLAHVPGIAENLRQADFENFS